jgi:hypothetical protein
MAKSKLKLLARDLRRQKRSIKSIAKQLSVSVSSVSLWCRDIQLSPEEKNELFNKGYFAGTKARLQAIQARKERLNGLIKKIHDESILEVGTLTERELFIAGIALYWGEGFKKDKLVGLASMSPYIARFYIKWLQICFDIPKEKLLVRVTINSQKKENTRSIMGYWSKYLDIPLVQFSECYYQNTIQKKVYENDLDYHGVIRIKVRKSISILRKIEGYILALEGNS